MRLLTTMALLALCSTARPDCQQLVSLVDPWGGPLVVDIPTLEFLRVSRRRLEPTTDTGDVVVRRARWRRDGSLRITIDVAPCRRAVRPAEDEWPLPGH